MGSWRRAQKTPSIKNKKCLRRTNWWSSIENSLGRFIDWNRLWQPHLAVADPSFTYLHNSLGIRLLLLLLISWHQREWSGETRSWMKWVTYSDDWSLTDAFGADKSDGQSLGSSASIFATHISAGHWQEFFISYFFFFRVSFILKKKKDKRKMGMITSRLLIHSLDSHWYK